MVASIASNDDDPGFSAPAGWTLVSNESIVDRVRQAVYVKVAGVAEPGSYTWTLSEFRRVAGGITTYAGVDTTNPVDAIDASVNTNASLLITAPSITTTVPDTLLVHVGAINAAANVSAPAGMTERWEADSPNLTSTRDVTASSSDAPFAGAASTGSRAAVSSASGPSIGVLLALRPAS
jgi:hypothetical protein